MRRILLTVFALLIAVFANAGWIPFVNKNGVYKPFDEKTDIVKTFVQTDKCPKGSFNYYRSCLGYLDGEVVSHFNDECYFIALNVFSNDVIFIIPQDTTKTTLTQQEVDSYLAGYKIDEGEFARKLRDGVEEKSIRQSFVEMTLGIKAENGILKDELHGYTYSFKNGLLVGYESDDGLSEDAKDIKASYPRIFDKIETNAKRHYGAAPSLVAKYINGQCKYFRTIDMTYLRTASNSTINYNYALLYCVLYSGVSLDDFMFLVPDAELSSSVNNYIIMSYGNYMFTFKDKVLIKM